MILINMCHNILVIYFSEKVLIEEEELIEKTENEKNQDFWKNVIMFVINANYKYYNNIFKL